MAGNERVSFSGHETFPFRYTWLRKAVQAVEADGNVFNREDAMVRFGVGKNMVGSIRHWGIVAGVIEEDPESQSRSRLMKVSELGRCLFADGGWDPYLEDPATLWVVQWQMATNRERATTWAWAFGHLPRPEFSRAELQGWLMTLVEQHGNSRASETTIARDVDCFIRTYVPTKPTRSIGIEDTVECPLVELNLIREFGTRGNYVLSQRSQALLPDGVFAYALVSYLQSRQRTAGTVPLDNVAFSAGAPGRVFCLSEEDLLGRLARLQRSTNGDLALDETAGLRQNLVNRSPNPYELLKQHYSRWQRDSKPVAGAGR